MSTEPTLRVPMLVPTVDVRTLPLGALEGFLLSRIDGAYTLLELGEMTGLGVDAVTDVVTRLVSLGAVSWKVADLAQAPPRSVAAAARTSERAKTPTGGARGTPGHGSLRPDAVPQTVIPALYDPVELEEDVDLERDRRRQILDTFYQLATTNYYQLLEVAPDADKKSIRAAYFALSKAFHPDTMFRKRLGTYKQKMEVIFGRLTEAYETLSKKKTRAAYDDYLSLTEVTQSAQQQLAQGEKIAAREAARVGGTPAHGLPISPQVGEVLAPPVAPVGSPSPPPAATPSSEPRPPPTDEQRRRMQELLQYRLKEVSRDSITPKTSAPLPPSQRPADPQGAGRELARTLQQTAVLTGSRDFAARHLADGLRAEREGKLVEAVNSLGIARAIERDHEEVIREHERLKKLLAVELAETYLKQARYEEQLGKWGEAALSWARVCEGRPDDFVAHRRAAEALLKTNGDLHRARGYAQRAAELAPADAKAHATLGRVFIAAGLKLNAKRELEISTRLDPEDDLVKNLLRDLK